MRQRLARAAVRIGAAGRVTALALGALLVANPNAIVFILGLAVLALSVAQWSRPTAGVIVGVVLMIVAAWPFLRAQPRGSE